jgi:hypothetical protein
VDRADYFQIAVSIFPSPTVDRPADRLDLDMAPPLQLVVFSALYKRDKVLPV